MADAVILSVIESWDGWLLKKGCLADENLEKLCSLIVGMSDSGEERKEMVQSLLLQFGMEEDKNERKRNTEKLYKLLDLNKEKMYSLVVGMLDFWEDNNGKVYHLLFGVAEGVDTNVNIELEISDLWGNDEGELNKEKVMWAKLNIMMHKRSNKMIRSISDQVAKLWKDKQPKLNKEKLYTWLRNKLDLCEPEKLFGVLLDAVLLYDSSSYVHKAIRESVEEAKREFRIILNLITDKKLGEESSLRYFISDLVDIAHHVHVLIHVNDSDPFALFFESSVHQGGKCFDKKFKHIMNELQEIKVSLLGFRVERLKNVREMEEGGKNVVGLEKDIKLLLSDEYNGKTTIIRGMVGSGKTTIARQVYNISQQFERRAWVCLSKMLSRKEMLVSLIRQVVDSNELASLENIECADYESLKQMLHQQLLGMRYFIVLDDVWENTTHFKYVTKALPRDNQGSRLLLTTSTKIRDLDNNGVLYHDMESMDKDKSWTLLLKTLAVEGSDEQFPKTLVKKARQILMKKCGGLPLAIKEVGRHWAKERQSGSEWGELIESIDLSETLRELESSYHNWNPKLKSYFLHLAFFKEGTTIRVKRLVHIWMAMGVVSGFQETHDKKCLEELLENFIIRIIDMDNKANKKTFCIHVVFHMLSIRKAQDELNFEILNKDGNNRPSQQPHHRAIYCSREKMMNYSSNQDKNLVSLFYYGGGTSEFYWENFKQLKTLDMEDFGLKILPDVIGMLSELIYLGLRNNFLRKLPHSLSRLKKLEVLDISLNFMVEVEDIIWKMDSLCHLYMSDISCQKPLRIDALKKLETWTYISVQNWTYEASRLEMMTSLFTLGIQEVDGNTNVSKLFASLAKLGNLSWLIIRGFRFKSMPSLDEIGILRNVSILKLDGLITRLPSANNFPPTILHLSLVNSCLHEDPMPILEKLSHLRYLKLQNAYTGQQMVISHNHFSFLLFLVIEELWHLTNVQVGKGAMQMLKDLEINNCPYLDTLPEDYFPIDDMLFKMKTTKKNATKIRESSFVSRIKKVDIQP